MRVDKSINVADDTLMTQCTHDFDLFCGLAVDDFRWFNCLFNTSSASLVVSHYINTTVKSSASIDSLQSFKLPVKGMRRYWRSVVWHTDMNFLPGG